MCTSANSVGAQHPFISWSVADDYIKQLDKLDEQDREARISLFNDFVLDGTKLGVAQVMYFH